MNPSDGVIKSTWKHKGIIGLPKTPPNKQNSYPFNLCITEKMTRLPTGKIFSTDTLIAG